MKFLTIAVTAAALAMAGCSDDKIPQACEDVIDTVKEIGKEAPNSKQMLDQIDAQMEQARKDWKNLSKEEREQAKTQCEAMKTQMDAMKKQIESLK